MTYTNKYFTKWKIKVNCDKTQMILFPFNKSPKRTPTASLTFQGTNIQLDNCVKYLGVHIDRKLSFKQHIDITCDKSMKCIRSLYPILCKNSKLNHKNKMLVFKMCIRPVLMYACPVWKTTPKTYIKKLQIIQNKALKIIHGLERTFSTRILHERYKHKMVSETIESLSLTFFNKCRDSTFELIKDLAN